MPNSTALKPSVTLAHITLGDLVQLLDFQAPPVSGAGDLLELRRGEVVQCLRNDGYGVLITRGDGSRMLVPVASARNVWVRWCPESSDSEGFPQGFSHEADVGGKGETRRWKKAPPATQVGSVTGMVERGKRLEALRRSDD